MRLAKRVALIRHCRHTPQGCVDELPPSIRVGLILLLWTVTAYAGTFPVHAQSTGVYLDPIFLWPFPCHNNLDACPHLQQIVVYQGQGQVCWKIDSNVQQFSLHRDNCTTSSAWAIFYDGDIVTFTATGLNGYTFDHWILPDPGTCYSSTYDMSIPYGPVSGPMRAVFVG
jgi:hypothetical protein